MGGKWAAEVKAGHAPGRLGPPDVTVWEQGEAGRSGIGLVWWVGARLPVWRRVPGRASAQDIYVKVTRKLVITWTSAGTNNYFTPIDY